MAHSIWDYLAASVEDDLVNKVLYTEEKCMTDDILHTDVAIFSYTISRWSISQYNCAIGNLVAE